MFFYRDRYCVSYYSGKYKSKENGILYSIEIKNGAKVTANQTSAFPVLDKLGNNNLGSGTIVCMSPQGERYYKSYGI